MKTKLLKKLSLTVLAVCGVATMLFIGQSVAFAAQQQSQILISVKGKGLTLSAPAAVDMGSIDVNVEDTILNGAFNGIVVTDLRGNKTPLGWSATITASEFADKDDPTLKIPFSQMNLTPGTNPHFQVVAGDPNGLTYINTAKQFTDGNGDGISDPLSLITAPAGKGAGQYSISVILKLVIPAFTPAGNYGMVLTSTVS